MSATVAEARYNLRTVARTVAARLDVDPRNLSYDERRDYNRNLAAEILRYPNGFTPEILASAAQIRDQGPQADSLSVWGSFIGDVTDTVLNTGASVAGIGNGVLTAARWSAWLIPLAVVAFVILWLMRRPPSGPHPARA